MRPRTEIRVNHGGSRTGRSDACVNITRLDNRDCDLDQEWLV